MALRLLHRLRIFGAVFAVPPSVTAGLSEDAFGAAANRLAVSAFDEMEAWVRLPASSSWPVLPCGMCGRQRVDEHLRVCVHAMVCSHAAAQAAAA